MRLSSRKNFLVYFLVLFVIILSPASALAIVKYWIGASGANFGTGSNWSTTSGGSPDTTAPGSLDIATFDGNGNTNCNIGSNVNVAGIDIKTGYTATITQNNTYTITVGASRYVQADGTFSGGNADIDFNENFTLSGGTFTSTSGNAYFADNFTVSGGTWNHNNGTVIFDGGLTSVLNVTVGGLNFYNFTQTNFNLTDTLEIGTSGTPDTITVLHTLTLTKGDLGYGTINAQGDVIIGALYNGNDTNPASVIVNGSDPQAITLTGGGFGPTFTLNNASATVSTTGTGTFTFEGTYTLQNGATNSSTINITTTGNFSQSGGTFGGVNSGSTLIYKANLDVSGGTYNGNTGNIDVETNFILSGGTFNSTSGNLRPADNFTVSGGTFNPNNGTVTFYGGFTSILDVTSGGLNFYNLTQANANGTDTLEIGSSGTPDTITVLHTLTLTKGDLGYGTINAQGDVLIGALYTGNDTNPASVIVNGSDPQAITLTGGGFGPTFTLNNASATVSTTGTGTFTFDGTYTLQNGVTNSSTIPITTTGNFSQSGGTFGGVNTGVTLTYTGDLDVSGGTYNGNAGTLDVNGNFILSSGTFNSTSGNLRIDHSFTVSGGTFNHGNGTVTFDGPGNGALDVPNEGLIFYGFTHAVTNNLVTLSLGSSGTPDAITVNGPLTLTDGDLAYGTINAKGDITLGTFYDGNDGVNTTSIIVNGSSTQTLTFNGGGFFPNFTLNNASATLSFTGSGAITFENTFTFQNGIVNSTPNTVNINGAYNQSGGTWHGTNTGITQNFKDSFTMSAGTFNGNLGNIDIDGAFNLSGGTFNASAGDTLFAHSYTRSTGTFNHNNGRVIFNGTNIVTIDVPTSETFYKLKFNCSNTETKSINNNDKLIVLNDLNFTNGTSSSVDTNNPGIIEARGNVFVEAGWDGGDAELHFTQGNAQNFDLTSANALYNGTITINKTGNAVLLLSNLTLDTVGQKFILTAGSFDISTYTFRNDGATQQDGGNFTANNGTLDFNGTFTLNGGTFNAPTGTMTSANTFTVTGGTFNHNNGNLTFDAATARTVDVATSLTIGALTINKNNGETITITSGDTLIVTGTLTCTNGAFGTGTIEAQGNVSLGTACDSGTSPLKFSGGGVQTIDPSSSAGLWDGDVFVNKNAGQVDIINNNWTLNAANQDLTIEEGTLDINGRTLVVNGTSGKLIVETGGILQLQGGETITANTNYPQLDAGSTVSYDGGGSYNIKNYSYHHLTTNGSGTYTMGAGETLGGNLDIKSGTFSLNGQNLTVTGTFSNTGALRLNGDETTVTLTMDTDSGIVDYVGTGTYNSLKLGNTYYDLRFTGSGTHKHNATLTVNRDLLIGLNATLDSLGNNIIISGNWTNDRTYTSGANTVTFNGTNQTIAGGAGTTFNNLTKTVTSAATLTFKSGIQTTVTGTATLQGAASQLLSIRSDVDTVYATVAFNGTTAFKYLDVKDQDNNNGGAAAVCNSACTNSGHNQNWNFTLPTIQLQTASSNANENVANPNITVILSSSVLVNTSVNYSVTAGTATGGGTDYTLASGTATINAGGTSVNITPTINDDSLDENNETIEITISTAVNATLSGNTVHTFTINDNDAAPTVTLSSSGTTMSETGGSRTLTATISAASGLDVTVDLGFTGTATLTDDYTRSGTSITITAGSTTGTVMLNAAGDSMDEDDETVISDITGVTNGTESGTQQQTITITDDDAAPAVTWTAASQSSADENGTMTVTAQLSAASGRTITVPYTLTGTATGGNTDYSITASPVTINAGSTSTNVTITIATDTLDENNETVIVTMGAPTNASQGATTIHTATITDDDATPTVTLSGGTSISETGGSQNLTATLSAASGLDITINLGFSGTATLTNDYTRSGTSISISAGSTTGTVTISAAADTLDENNETVITDITGVTNGTESGTQQQTVTISDDDNTPTVSWTVASQSSAGESGTLTLTAQLSAASGLDVTVPYTLTGTATGGDYSITASPVTITAGGTTTDVTITIAADSLDEANETVIASMGSPTNASQGATTVHTATITDDDAAPSVTLSGTTSISETGGSQNLTATLSAVSGQTVTINLGYSGTATLTNDYNRTGTSIVINAGSTTGTVGVSSVSDSIDEANETVIVDIASVSNGTESGVQQQTITITDDDTAGVTVTQSGGSTNVTEGSSADTYTIVLTSQPTSDVSITVGTSAQASLDKANLTFTTANWSTVQTITVSANNDSVAEGSHTANLTHSASSSDTVYNNFSITSVTVNITDNDSAAVSIVESAGATSVTEAGGTDTYTVVLTSQPLADVSISVSPNAQLTTNSTSLTFTTANWNIVQTITVSAVNDNDTESSPHSGTITHTATSGDGTYNSIAISSITAGISDNDTPGITISESGGATSITEGGSGDSYTIVLNSRPTANVTITLNTGTQLSGSASSITFTTGNWSTVQTISVSAINDIIAEGNHAATITHAVASSDANYNNRSISSVTANITDNDAASVQISQTGGSTSLVEGGATDTYTFVLSTQPTNDVTITINAGSQTIANPSSITFTSANWDTVKTVTVNAVDDSISESNHAATITHTASSPDAFYNNISLASVTANISDNDSAGISLTQSGGSTNIAEGSTTDNYDIVLTSQPSSNVTVAIVPDSQSTVSSSSATFTTSNWNVPQTITITAVNDAVAEGNHLGTISHTISSSDALYAALGASNMNISISDNDTAGVSIMQSDGNTLLTEGSGSDSYTLVLTSKPRNTVTITVNPDSQTTVSPATLTFTSSNWDSPQTITVSGVDDHTTEASQNGTITHSASSSDTGYNNIGIQNITVTLSDPVETPDDPEDNEPDEPENEQEDTSPVANAGFNRTVVAGNSVTLDGSASQGNGLRFSWSIQSGSGSISNANSEAPIFTLQSDATSGNTTIILTVTDNQNRSSTDTIIINAVANVSGAQVIDDTPPAAMSEAGTISVTSSNNNIDLTVTNTNNSTNRIILPANDVTSNMLTALTHEGYVVIALPSGNGNRGLIYISKMPSDELPARIDLTARDETDKYFHDIEGSTEDEQMGTYLSTGDINDDGIDEIFVSAPAAGNHGIVYIYDIDGDLVSIIFGSADHPLSSVVPNNFFNDTSNDLIFGPDNLALNSDLVRNDSLDNSQKISQAPFLKGSRNFSGSIDFSDMAPDLVSGGSQEYQSVTFGDVNGDGYQDLIMAADDSTIGIFFGPAPMDNSRLTDPDVIIIGTSISGDFGSMIISGDVNGDGIDDIIIGAPDYGDNDEGAVIAVFGSEGWESIVDLSTAVNAMLILGNAEGSIGEDLLIADDNGDDVLEVFTLSGKNDDTLRISFLEGSSTSPTTGSHYSLGGDGGCSINNNITYPSIIWVLLITPIVIMRKLRKINAITPSHDQRRSQH